GVSMTRHVLGFIAAAVTVLAVAAATALAGGGPGNPGVSHAHMQGWAAVNDTCGAATTGSGGFGGGPGPPPRGKGSLELKVGANGDSYPSVRTARFDGVPLSSLTALSYSTYVSAAPGSQAAYIDLYVDTNGDNARDDILTFEPVYNGTVQRNTW